MISTERCAFANIKLSLLKCQRLVPNLLKNDRNCSNPSQYGFQSSERFIQYSRSRYTIQGWAASIWRWRSSIPIATALATEHRWPTQRSPLYSKCGLQFSTYDHRILKTRLPVRSALFKQDTGGLVVRWVTTSESPLLYVFASLFASSCYYYVASHVTIFSLS
jgi:hypothetical protein